jgi:RNA polymerase sigma factor (sigma-70 family)
MSQNLSLAEKLRRTDWTRHRLQIMSQLRWYLSPSDLEDAANDTILTLLQNIEDFDAGQSHYEDFDDQLGAFLHSLTRFTRLKYQRRRYQLKDLIQPLTQDPSSPTNGGLLPEDLPPLDADNIHELLSTTLAGCGPSLCDVADYYLQGMAPGEIAKKLGLPPDTIHNRLRELRKKLRKARGDATRDAVTKIVYSSQPTMTELLTGRRTEPLPLPGCGYEEENSLDKFEQTIDELPNLDENDRLTLKQARRDLEELYERDAFDRAFVCETLVKLTHELTQDKPQTSLLERFMSNLAELAPSIASILSSLATLAQMLKK